MQVGRARRVCPAKSSLAWAQALSDRSGAPLPASWTRAPRSLLCGALSTKPLIRLTAAGGSGWDEIAHDNAPRTLSTEESGKKMAKVPPYNTDFEEHPAEYRDVYHDHDDCPEGRLILPHRRKSGYGGKPQCKKCAEDAVALLPDYRPRR